MPSAKALHECDSCGARGDLRDYLCKLKGARMAHDDGVVSLLACSDSLRAIGGAVDRAFETGRLKPHEDGPDEVAEALQRAARTLAAVDYAAATAPSLVDACRRTLQWAAASSSAEAPIWAELAGALAAVEADAAGWTVLVMTPAGEHAVQHIDGETLEVALATLPTSSRVLMAFRGRRYSHR